MGVRGTGCNVVKKFLQHKAIEEETSISDLINERFEEEMSAYRCCEEARTDNEFTSFKGNLLLYKYDKR